MVTRHARNPAYPMGPVSMIRWLLCGGVLLTANLARAEEHTLPEPYSLAVPDDPAWLATVVQVHGHLGPWVVIGARFGMAALKAVDARGYFDVEIACQGPLGRPPRSCFLDGVQVGSGTRSASARSPVRRPRTSCSA